MGFCFGSISKLTTCAIVVLFLLSSFGFTSTDAFDALDPNGNITIKWDLISWTPDGYVAVVTMFNFQQYRHIQTPGWSLGWTWAKKEVIWSMVGGQTTEQGDCSKFKGNIPHCCKKDPTVVDLLPGTPYNQQIANCCKGGVINSWVQDPSNAASSFQISVGGAGTTNKTVRVPKTLTLKAPGPGYTCGPAKVGKPTKFVTQNVRKVTQAMMTWNVTCTYSQFLAQKTPTCCVSLSSFYNNTIVPCPTCTCGCQNNNTQPPQAPPTASREFRDFINCCLQRAPSKRWTIPVATYHIRQSSSRQDGLYLLRKQFSRRNNFHPHHHVTISLSLKENKEEKRKQNRNHTLFCTRTLVPHSYFFIFLLLLLLTRTRTTHCFAHPSSFFSLSGRTRQHL
ncbi:protein COBRA-like [Camellia sinensis]|uniref:protein COBRA-like n=1 Tax=Camellia sinensis TaxID=4442 RepID=UPI001035FCD9|nr:protein COBRA-like [Camellia sinensis]